ncbi:MAG: winged helix-turn-helix domain-containing protein [Cyanobacteria bacterium P01_F01_bin.143]
MYKLKTSKKSQKKLLKRQPEILPLIQVCLVLWLIKKTFQSVRELAENSYFSQTTVRKHLGKLEEWGVVKGESWQPVRYFIADDAPQDFISRCHKDKLEYKISLFLRCIDV